MGALDGVRVIDLTVWFQGPVAAQHLADFGAEVIKVERPKGGDQGRGVRSIKALPVGDWNQYFLVINRNKKSIAIDLKKARGQEVLYRLIERSDVFLSNLAVENLEAWNLGWEKVREVNPRIVYATNTGYGRYGQVGKPSFDMTVQALTGLMPRLGEPGQPPIYLGMGSGDAYGGLFAALGILMALHQRRRTGRGQLVDASLYGAQLFLAAPSLQPYLATGDPAFARQRSRKSPRSALWNAYRAADRWLWLCAEDRDDAFARLGRALARPALAADERWRDAAARRAHADELVAALDAAFAERAAGEWVEALAADGLLATPIGTLEDLATDPGAWENGYLQETWCEEVGRRVKIRGMPITLSKTPGEVRSLGPELGQDTELFLTDALGYDWDELGELKSEGVIP